MSAITVPAVLDAVLAAVRAALPATQVFDGPPQGDEQDTRVVIGWARTRPTITVTRDLDTLGITPAYTERYAIPGVAISYSGDPDVKPRRDAAYTLVQAVADAVISAAGITSLGAAAQLATGDLTQEKTGTGVQALVDFTITVTALS